MDSLLVCNGFDGCDLRQRFRAWLEYGYNNAFGRDKARESKQSVGLGGNISQSMSEWCETGKPMTEAGDQFTSGNGSVMRNGAIPVWFRDDLERGMEAGYKQSRTTHQGEEAAELCRLLTFVCIKFINGAGRELLDDLGEFTSPLYTVSCLAKAKREEAHPYNANPVFGGLDRRIWEWKNPEYRYCEYRAEENPGYIGSYAMDNVSMALHCLYTTSSFADATLKAANLCGDSDSVCAVVGQLAGALYGVSAIPPEWIDKVQQWDGGTILARAVMLHKHEALPHSESVSDEACASARLLSQKLMVI
jgi:ADP-ribosyl-[dinitrogen reductase] hydrolase